MGILRVFLVSFFLAYLVAYASFSNAQEETEKKGNGDVDQKEEQQSVDKTKDTQGQNLNLVDLNVDCSIVKPFSKEIFGVQSDKTKVYKNVEKFSTSGPAADLFLSVGFDKFIMVFGIPVVGSTEVTNEQLQHATNILADVIDNDRDGVPDRMESLEKLRGYYTVIGYVSDPDESADLWDNRFTKPENKEFRDQFICNMHFFEQWAVDATPEYHDLIEKTKTNAQDAKCAGVDGVSFDWPLWYMLFTLTYYGDLEVFDQQTIQKLESALQRGREEGYFLGRYPEDHDMELADYFVWTLLTKLGALQCHCEDSVIGEVWRLCKIEDAEKFGAEWKDIIDSTDGLIQTLPDGKYQSPALQ